MCLFETLTYVYFYIKLLQFSLQQSFPFIMKKVLDMKLPISMIGQRPPNVVLNLLCSCFQAWAKMFAYCSQPLELLGLTSSYSRQTYERDSDQGPFLLYAFALLLRSIVMSHATKVLSQNLRFLIGDLIFFVEFVCSKLKPFDSKEVFFFLTSVTKFLVSLGFTRFDEQVCTFTLLLGRYAFMRGLCSDHGLL